VQFFPDPRALQEQCLQWKSQGLEVGFVPTMGALHEGHISLVEAARQSCDKVVVSIFVNPLQFGPSEDLDAYPRTLEADSERLARVGVDALFLPDVETVYPEGHETRVSVSGISQGLCGGSRPGHFDGVTTVVAILFQIVQPDIAFFGKKDFQQWRVIERMTRDLFMSVKVCGLPIVREADGLAMSSRNAYLCEEDRQRALGLSRALKAAKACYESGERRASSILQVARDRLEPKVDRVDYIELRDSKSLKPIESLDSPAVLLVAAFLGATRLIDNMEIGEP